MNHASHDNDSLNLAQDPSEKKFRITKPNFTQIPNVIFDHWMKHLTPFEFKVLLCICRKTFGWHKERDKISLKQIVDFTGISKSTVTVCIEKLITLGLVSKFKSKDQFDGGDAPNVYEINVCEIEEIYEEGGVNETPPVSVSRTPPRVRQPDTQKKDSYTKEKDICADFVDAQKSKNNFTKKKKDPRLTVEQREKLVKEYGEEKTMKAIKELECWKESKSVMDPKALEKHTDYERIRKWVMKSLDQQAAKPKSSREKMRELVEKKFKHGEKYNFAYFYIDDEKVEIIPEGAASGRKYYFNMENFLDIFEHSLKHFKLYDYWKKP